MSWWRSAAIARCTHDEPRYTPLRSSPRILQAALAGFTLVEMVVAISITAIIVGILATIIAPHMQAYFAQTRRAMLVDSANTCATPNSQ